MAVSIGISFFTLSSPLRIYFDRILGEIDKFEICLKNIIYEFDQTDLSFFRFTL